MILIELTWSTPSPPATLPLSVSDRDYASSISSTSSHRRVRPSAKRRSVLERASIDYSCFRLARWSYLVYRPSPTYSSLQQPPVVRGQSFSHLTSLTMPLRPMTEEDEGPCVELAMFECPAFPHLQILTLWSWGKVFVTKDEIDRCFRVSVSR